MTPPACQAMNNSKLRKIHLAAADLTKVKGLEDFLDSKGSMTNSDRADSNKAVSETSLKSSKSFSEVSKVAEVQKELRLR